MERLSHQHAVKHVESSSPRWHARNHGGNVTRLKRSPGVHSCKLSGEWRVFVAAGGLDGCRLHLPHNPNLGQTHIRRCRQPRDLAGDTCCSGFASQLHEVQLYAGRLVVSLDMQHNAISR